MDAIDIKILRILCNNARQKASAISQEINLSVSAVIERMRKLEDNGVIAGYTAVLDQKRLGHDIIAMMDICMENQKHHDAFVAFVQRSEHVEACDYLTGEVDFTLRVAAASSDELEVLHQQIKQLEGVCTIKTHVVLKQIKRDVPLLPDLN